MASPSRVVFAGAAATVRWVDGGVGNRAERVGEARTFFDFG